LSDRLLDRLGRLPAVWWAGTKERLVTTKLPARDVLPFPPTPSASSASKTTQESVYKQRVAPRRLAAIAQTGVSSG
jgi:hypothetical protein